jgi:NAD(P)H-hydrate repair Nnr-like enzyme with NAD(P)H-hydrate dehydratase domain
MSNGLDSVRRTVDDVIASHLPDVVSIQRSTTSSTKDTQMREKCSSDAGTGLGNGPSVDDWFP